MKVRLPAHIQWSGPREYDLRDVEQLRRVYELVLREGTARDVRRYIDPAVLREHWPALNLPAHVRVSWEDYFRREDQRRRGEGRVSHPVSDPAR